MEKINSIIKKEIEELEIKDLKECSFILKLNEIILENKRNIKIPKYRNNIDFEKSFQYSKKFFDTISKEYSSYLDKRRKEGVFLFNNDVNSLAFSNLVDGKKIIHFPIIGTIEDSYTITHEIIHDMSISDEYSINRYLFCETVSLLAEMLQKDYFHNNERPKDYLIDEKEILYALQNKAVIINFEFELINIYLSNGYISKNNLIDIMNKHSFSEIDLIINDIETILTNEEMNFSYEQRYIIGYTIASYMHNRILKKNNVSEFIDINDSLNTYSIEQLLTYLDLDYKNSQDLDLTDESYEKIEKSYIKQIKSI